MGAEGVSEAPWERCGDSLVFKKSFRHIGHPGWAQDFYFDVASGVIWFVNDRPQWTSLVYGVSLKEHPEIIDEVQVSPGVMGDAIGVISRIYEGGPGELAMVPEEALHKAFTVFLDVSIQLDQMDQTKRLDEQAVPPELVWDVLESLGISCP